MQDNFTNIIMQTSPNQKTLIYCLEKLDSRILLLKNVAKNFFKTVIKYEMKSTLSCRILIDITCRIFQ